MVLDKAYEIRSNGELQESIGKPNIIAKITNDYWTGPLGGGEGRLETEAEMNLQKQGNQG